MGVTRSTIYLVLIPIPNRLFPQYHSPSLTTAYLLNKYVHSRPSWHLIQSASSSLMLNVSSFYISYILTVIQSYVSFWPFYERRVSSVLRIPFVWSRTDVSLVQSSMPYRICIVLPCVPRVCDISDRRSMFYVPWVR